MSSRPATSTVRHLTIAPDQAGQRIDNYLISQLKGVPKSHVYQLLRKGEVRVNKGRVKPHYRLASGDQVRIPPVRTGQAGAAPDPKRLDWLDQAILYEDKELLILNKPSGIAVHGGSGLSYGAIEALRALRPEAHFLELVHRLDRATSGCLMIAKKRSMLRRLHELLRGEGLTKEYLALVKGRWRGRARAVEAALAKNVLRSGERMVEVREEGKASLSVFTPERVFDDATLVRIALKTGRTHQIRVHAAHIGHPIAGDDKYGEAEFNARMRTAGLRRLFLHAHRLMLRLPEDGRTIDVTAPLGPDLQAVLDALEGDA